MYHHLPLVDNILAQYTGALGKHYTAYRNHVYRLVNLIALNRLMDEDTLAQVSIAGAFHDLGLFTHATLDYLPPSAQLARQYLAQHHLSHWQFDVVAMIDNHHKLTSYPHNPLTELFRRADWAEVTFGVVGLRYAQLPWFIQLYQTFPDAGFHVLLVQKGAHWALRHPLNPLPILKW